MTNEPASRDDIAIEDKPDAFEGDLYSMLPDDVREGLTGHFLALMGADPLPTRELLAA